MKSKILIKTKHKVLLSTMILLLLPIIYFLRFILNWDIRLASFLWFMIAGIAFIYVWWKQPIIIKKMLPLLMIDIMATIAMMVNHTHDIWYMGILFAIQSWGALLYCKRSRLKPLAVLSIFIILYLTYRVAISPRVLINSWQYGLILSNLVRQNTVSIFLVEFLSYYLICRYNNNESINYIIFAISMLAAFICGGMGGILSIAIFLVGIVMLNRKKDNVAVWKVVLLFVVFIMVIYFMNATEELVNAVTDDNGRFYIWSNYFNCIDSFKDLFFGADVSNVPFLKLANNMHNTILNWHYCYGLIPLIYFIYRTIKTGIYCLRKKRHTYLIILGVTLFRAMTDEADFAFGGIWTYIWLESIFDSMDLRCDRR